jgi:lipopolysaccharide transport system ATP-binding protein
MNKNIAIKVTNLTKTYKLYKEPMDRLKESLNPFGKKYHNDFHALKDVSFEIKKGETIGIIGRNGSGKSTLLKIITGVLTPSGGRINVHGKISAILELGAGFNPEMSGLENIYLNTSINGMSRQDTDKKIDEILAFAELSEFIHQPIKTYSSGMKARLGFAVAINIEPDILIVDEALAVGDAAFQRKCFAKMEQIREAGATILFVSHSERSIVSLCSRAIWLSNGEKIIEGKPKLITGLYMKNANKKVIDRTIIEKEFQEVKKSLEKKDEFKKKELPKKVKLEIEEFYDPSLKPKSTIYYEEKGAKISDIKVTTLDGREVNVLVQGREYLFKYKVNLNEINHKILCAMFIKNMQGINLGGGHYPKRNTFMLFNSKEFFIKWKWKCNLVQGVFFINCGISDTNGFLHRIIDSYSIKVIENNTDTQSYQIVDFNIKAQYE